MNGTQPPGMLRMAAIALWPRFCYNEINRDLLLHTPLTVVLTIYYNNIYKYLLFVSGGLMENNHFNVAWAKSTALYTKAASVLGVGYPEMMVLYALESMGELTQKQIAENFGMQKQTVHTVVSALQKKGYLLLEASEGDKREKRIVLTESGQVYAHRMIAPLRKAEEKVYRTIGNERLQAMCEILDLFNLLFERELSGGLGSE